MQDDLRPKEQPWWCRSFMPGLEVKRLLFTSQNLWRSPGSSSMVMETSPRMKAGECRESKMLINCDLLLHSAPIVRRQSPQLSIPQRSSGLQPQQHPLLKTGTAFDFIVEVKSPVLPDSVLLDAFNAHHSTHSVLGIM